MLNFRTYYENQHLPEMVALADAITLKCELERKAWLEPDPSTRIAIEAEIVELRKFITPSLLKY